MLNIHRVNTEHGPLHATYYVGCTPKWFGPRGLGKKHVGFTPEILGYSVRLRIDKQIYDCRLSSCFLCKGGVFQQKMRVEHDLDMFVFFCFPSTRGISGWPCKQACTRTRPEQ